MLYETKKDCPPVESLIWDKVCCSFGDFEGVKELSFAELSMLRSACYQQMQVIINNGIDTE